MILLAASLMLCQPVPVPKPRPIYTKQQRLKDAFADLARKPVSANFLYELK
jgi:hypothetical protein